MSVVIRLARAGTKKRPVYHVVVADSRFPRDGRFIERLGHFNPLLPKDNEARLKLDMDKVKAWMAKGAQPSDRVMRFLDAAGVKQRTARNNPETKQQNNPQSTKDGARQFEVSRARAAKDHLVAMLKGVADRDAAERLNGIELYITRAALPDTDEGEYYHADLIGLAALDAQGASLGAVTAIHNFGAGDNIELAPKSGPSLLQPFTNAVVPTVDLPAGHVVIELPSEIEGDEPDPADSAP